MGYPNDRLGDYRNVKTGAVIPDILYNRMPGGLRSGYVKVQVQAAPIKVLTATQKLVQAITARAPSGTSVPQSAPLPSSQPGSPPPPAVNAFVQTVQNAAPIVAATAAPVVGPIASTLPAVVDAVTQPAPLQMKIVPDASVPTDSGTQPSTVDEASVTGSPDMLSAFTALPTSAKLGLAGIALFILARHR